MFRFKEKLIRIRYWVIKKLIGDMPVVANIRISDYDVEQFYGSGITGKPHMLFGNRIYKMEKYILESVWTGNNGKVSRSGNTFVLTR